MCGIVGIVRSSSSPAIAVHDVRRMADAIVHRGPDDEGFFASEHAILGMRRLSIIDLSGGHQPIANEDGSLHVVCNGEIYNFRQLRQRLQAQGHRFRTGSDVETLVHLYEEHGDSFLAHVNGMFGLALWDTRRHRLILARDRMGQKPLYYLEHQGTLAFASEIKALLELPFVQAAIDTTALREYLSLGYSVAPRTIFAGIRKLPPASRLTWERDTGLRVERYWQIARTTEAGLDAPQWAERVRHELRRAVTDHMVSDVPIGAFLSGGIDSSAVVALMSEQSDRPVNTYSIGYAGDGAATYYNELAYAGQVARQFGTNHHEIVVKPDVAALLPKLLWHLEEPISDSATATTYLVSELAAQSVKVILSGVGGDELFAGYNRYLGDHYTRQYRRVPAWIRQQLVRPLAEALPSGRQSRAMDLARYAKKFVRAGELPWHQQYRLFIEILEREQLVSLLLQPVAGADGFDAVAAGETAADPLLRLMCMDAETQLPEDLLLLTDKMTMAKSIECRVPFLDYQLVECVAAIPAGLKLRDGELKHVLKQALHGILPDEILYRRKRGFGAPVGAWFKRELRPLRDALLARTNVERRGLVAWPAVERILQAHDNNREDYTDVIMVLMNLEIWCRLFLDRHDAGEISAELARHTMAA